MVETPKKQVLVPIAEGFEEIETVAIINILRRAGVDVTIASIMGRETSLTLKGSNGISILADCYYEDCDEKEYDMIALPGGLKNAQLLADCKSLIKKLNKQKDDNKFYAAICASPAIVFEKHNLFKGELGTCHPSLESKLTDQSKIQERVVVSNKCITSRGPGTALEFAYTLVEYLFDSQKAIQLAKSMVARR